MERIAKARALAALCAAVAALILLPAATFAPSPSPAPAQSAAPATPTPGPAAGSNAAVLLRAREWIGRFQSGDIDRSQLTSDLSASLDSATVAQIKSVLPHGAPQSVALVGRDASSGNTVYLYIVTWPEGTLSFTFGLTAAGKIATAYFRQS